MPTGTPARASTARNEEFLEFLKAQYPETVSTEGRKALGFNNAANQRFDTVIQGRASYQLALDVNITSPYAQLRELVASRTLKESPDPNVELVSDDVVARVRELKAEDSELGIWLCGGSQLAGELIDEIDELVIKTYPIVHGSGMPMFGSDFAPTVFALDSVRVFGNGTLVRVYSRTR
ncbi:dihydrofolate reductase family protein [Streptomyces sp. NBC_01618]|uniref:dihydrofolate reductase family protein n=1 Tax=Streptomyces sp. NBC_01618 TaxID=2975900 RepID=UPI0038655921|nr:dihydrofolate reductase family protein [Streptomyces sp. NBC_01618]